MIGVNTSIFKSAGRKLVNLLGALKDRATHYENGTESTAEKNRIEGIDILDKATILLTPTATSDALVHSVKTYTGDELVINGTFDTNNDWNLGSGDWTISGGSASTTNGNNNLHTSNPVVPATGLRYKVTFTLQNVSQGYVRVGLSSLTSTQFNSDGTYTIYIESDGNRYLYFKPYGFTGSIDNVSVVDVSSDFDFDRASSATRINSDGLVQDMQSITDPELVLNGDFEELGDELITNGSFDTDSNWTKGTGWSISDGKASCDGSQASDTLIYENIGDQSNETIKFSFTVSDYVSGTLKTAVFGASGTTVHSITSNGDYTFYIDVASGHNGNTGFKAEVGFQGSIDNVSVKQVDPNDRWTLFGEAEFTAQGARIYSSSGGQSYINQRILTVGNQFRLTYDVVDSTQGAIKLINVNGVSDFTIPSTVGTHTVNFTANNAEFYIYRSGTTDITVDNISVKDITFSTDVDLARINYDSNGENGHILLEPTSTNLQDYSEAFNNWTHSNGSFTLTNDLAPDGLTKVYKSTVGGVTSSAHFYTGPPVLVIGQKYTASYFFKYVDHPWVRITHINSGNTGVWFNIQNGTVGTENGNSVGRIEDYGNGWYRCSNTFTATDTASTTNVFGAISDSDGNTNSVSGRSVLVWGAQVENLEYPTSYIPVHSTTSVTRAAETLLDSGNTTLINTDQGVFYAEIARTSHNANHELICLLQDAGYTNTKIAIGFYAGNNNFFIRTYYDSSDVYPIYDAITPNLNQFYKVAIKYNRNGINNVWIDGVKVVADVVKNVSAPSNPLTQLRFDWNPASTQFPFHGKCKAVAVFNEALEDDELELLTGVTNYGSFSELASANGYTII